MDLLKELEAKKEKLRLLKEKRQLIDRGEYHGASITSVLEDISIDKKSQRSETNEINRSKIPMVDVAVQTDNLITEVHLPALLPPIINDIKPTTEKKIKVKTFDHGVQTDYIKEFDHTDNDNDNNDRKGPPEETKENSSDSNFLNSRNNLLQTSKEENIFKGDPPKLFEMNPLIIDNEFIIENETNGATPNSNNTYESFASHWYARGENVKEETEINEHQEIGNTNNNKFVKGVNKIYHLHTCEIKDLQSEDSIVVCKSIDFDLNRHITLLAFSVMPLDSKKQSNNMDCAIPKSFVYVIDTYTDNIIDKVEFLGQTITNNKILRNNIETHNIISMVLLCKRGKIVLYELKKNVQQNDIRWDRNIVIKNYHLSCDYLKSIWETKFKLIIGDSNGYISILNSLDLSYDTSMFIRYDQDKDNNNKKFGNEIKVPISKIQVIPPSNSILYTITSEELSKENQLFIDEYLSNLVLFNEINITSIVGSPFNNECVFLGTENGGIYKIYLNISNNKNLLEKENNNKLVIDIQNNCFLPKVNDEELSSREINLHEKTLFHNGNVTSLSMNQQGLLLSCSIDWAIKLWDIKDNQLLDSINLQRPILSVNWIDISNTPTNNNIKIKDSLLNERYLCYAMTWDTIYIIQWFILKDMDPDKEKRNRKHFKKGKPAKILNKVHIDQETLCYNQFTSCKLVIDTIDDNNNLINALLILGGDKSKIDYIQIVINPH